MQKKKIMEALEEISKLINEKEYEDAQLVINMLLSKIDKE